MAIYFWKINDKYGCFSNFAYYDFELDGKRWMTSEHYFQAQKFCGTEFEKTTNDYYWGCGKDGSGKNISQVQVPLGGGRHRSSPYVKNQYYRPRYNKK